MSTAVAVEPRAQGRLRIADPSLRQILAHPGAFAWQTLKAFRANQGLLLAGAVAYYALLSIVPLLILSAIALTYVIDQKELLDTLARYLEWIVPGQSGAIVRELSAFLDHQGSVGWVLLATMLFFSSLGFTVLENAMSVIFVHRVAIKRRRFIFSALMPYCYILCLGIGLLLVTLVAGSLEAVGQESVSLLGREWSLHGVSGALLYLLGVVGEVFVVTSVYLVMPVGRLKLRHALIGGVTAAVLWEITRHVLVWYFATLSQVNVVYGSMTTAIVVLLSLEIAATLLLFGAQVISEYERVGRAPVDVDPRPFRTAAVPVTTPRDPAPAPAATPASPPAARRRRQPRARPD
ncbi:MAG TPA: YihY/virulence factor BrkB family protein [Caldimonas sp.]|nr:YihY/virulence factor BrkB family protein [Caldimonas sp.]